MTIKNNIKITVSSNNTHNICVFDMTIASVVLIYAITIKNPRLIFYVIEKVSYTHQGCIFDRCILKYNKNSNIVKYCYNLKLSVFLLYCILLLLLLSVLLNIFVETIKHVLKSLLNQRIQRSKDQHLFELEFFSIVIIASYIVNVSFNQCNVSLLNTSINSFKKKTYWNQTFEWCENKSVL